MSYVYGQSIDYSIAEILPAVNLGLTVDYLIEKGATLLVKVDAGLLECRVWIKRDGQLVDADA